jgi:hypothetical protein
VEFDEHGPSVKPQVDTKAVDVPPAVRQAAADALAKLPPPGPGQAPDAPASASAAPAGKVRIAPGASRVRIAPSASTKALPAAEDEAALQAQAEIDAAIVDVSTKKKTLPLPE